MLENIRVKPLEWDRHEASTPHKIVHYYLYGGEGKWRAACESSCEFSCFHDYVGGLCATEEEAKALCEEHWREMVLSCLEVTHPLHITQEQAEAIKAARDGNAIAYKLPFSEIIRDPQSQWEE